MNTEKLSNENETEALNKPGVMQGLSTHERYNMIAVQGIYEKQSEDDRSPAVASGAVGKGVSVGLCTCKKKEIRA